MSSPIKARKIGRNVPQSDLVDVGGFLKSWDLSALEAVRLKFDSKDHEGKLNQIKKRMKIDEDTAKELADVCKIESLFCGEEPKTRKQLLELTSAPNVHLECVHHQMDLREKFKTNITHLHAHNRYMKYTSLMNFDLIKGIESEKIQLESRVPVPNVILEVKVSKCLISRSMASKVRPSETFYILGTQTLCDLKDVLKCPLNEVIAGDYSSIPDVDIESLQKAKDIYKSGFFFIENVFYNDLRQQDNLDYTQPILDWAQANWSSTNLSVKDMATTQLLDLKIKLGCYYLFTHQGNCEHSVLFEDIRLFSADDPQDLSLYPLKTAERMRTRKFCQGCKKFSAKWVVFNSPLIPTDPCFLCCICFKTLLYDKEGNKLSNFSAHIYAEFTL